MVVVNSFFGHAEIVAVIVTFKVVQHAVRILEGFFSLLLQFFMNLAKFRFSMPHRGSFSGKQLEFIALCLNCVLL